MGDGGGCDVDCGHDADYDAAVAAVHDYADHGSRADANDSAALTKANYGTNHRTVSRTSSRSNNTPSRKKGTGEHCPKMPVVDSGPREIIKIARGQ